MSNLKYNINRLDDELSTFCKIRKFDFRKDGISLTLENLDERGLVIIANINEAEFSLYEANIVEWSYLANPNDINSKVNRKSIISNLHNDIKLLIEKNMFDKDYLNSINKD